MVPSGESPLLLPANQHKQLVVIDFEYANANLPGLEFANHFVSYCEIHGLQQLLIKVVGVVLQLP
jgi:thiamine kinase-like enzyme